MHALDEICDLVDQALVVPTCLPDNVIVQILSLLAPNEQAWAAKLVSKAAYEAFKDVPSKVPASTPGLPIWLLKRMYCITPPEQRMQLLAHRAVAGDVEGVMWLRSNNIRILDPSVITAVAGAGQLDMLRYLRPKCPWDYTACTAAAAGGHLEVLLWLRSQSPRCPWAVTEVCEAAAAGGHLHVLSWLREHHVSSWDPLVFAAAASTGQMAVLHWLVGQNPPADYDIAPVFTAAVAGGHVNVLDWLRSREHPRMITRVGTADCTAAAAGGYLETLQWLQAMEQPCRYGTATCVAAAAGGHLHVLRYLRSLDPPCPWGPAVCAAAAQGGHTHVLHWLRSQEPACPWNYNTCRAAAAAGRLDVLKWLRAQDPTCPWNHQVAAAAAEGLHLEALQWLLEQRPEPCPYTWHIKSVVREKCTGARKGSKAYDVLNYVMELPFTF